MTTDASWLLRTMTVMPDHIHLLFTLGDRLTLSQAVGRLKTTQNSSLGQAGGDWQQNFYDHQLRPGDSLEATIRYIWMNPYRERLISAGEVWPYFYCCPGDWEWFESMTDAGRPFPEWLGPD